MTYPTNLRLLGGTFAAALVSLTLIGMLGGTSTPRKILSTNLLSPYGSIPVPVPMTSQPVSPRVTRFVIGAQTSTQIKIPANSKYLGFTVGTHGATPSVANTSVRFGDLCEFRSGPIPSLSDNGRITLVGEPPCANTMIPSATPVEISIDVVSTTEVESAPSPLMSLWGVRAVRPVATAGWIALPQNLDRPSDSDPNVYLSAEFLLDSSTNAAVRRYEALASMWARPKDSSWRIMVPIGVGLAFVFIGYLLVGLLAERHPSRHAVNRIWGSTPALVFAGFGLIYAVITPPFQGPDEPQHFLGTNGQLGSSPQLNESALALAAEGSFDRLRYRPWEKFHPDDGRSDLFTNSQWGDRIASVEVSTRSPVGLWFNRIFLSKTYLDSHKASSVVLAHRLINVLVATLGLALGLLLLPVSFACLPIGGISILAACALPFFAMHVSNYPILLALYFVVGGVSIRLMTAEQMMPWSNLLLAVVSTLALGVSRSAVAGLCFSVFVLQAHILLVSANRGTGSWRPTMFKGLAAGIAFSSGFAGALSLELLPAEMWMVPNLPEAIRGWLTADFIQGSSQLVLIPLMVGLLVLSVIISSGVGIALRRFSGSSVEDTRAWAVARTYAPALAVLILILTAIIRSAPLPDIESLAPRMEPLIYARKVIKAFVLGLGLRSPDPLLTMTFWSGFGWLDTQMPKLAVWIMQFAVISTGVAAWIWSALRRRSPIDIIRIALVGAAMLIYLALLGAASASIPANLHGRYMLGFYVCAILFAGHGIGLAVPSENRETSRYALLTRSLIPMTAVFQCLAMYTVITRYVA